MSTAAGAAAASEISAKDIKVAPGVTALDTHRKQLVGSVLDLFSGKATRMLNGLQRDQALTFCRVQVELLAR